MARPHRKYSANELKEIAKKNPSSSEILQSILDEFSHRKSRRARRIKDYVKLLLAESEKSKRVAQASPNSTRRSLFSTDIQPKQKEPDGWFPWPLTNAPATKFGYLGDVFDYKDGLLSYVGYKVGHNGERGQVRREILDCIFYKELPNVCSKEYMEEWGDPHSPNRLMKLANAIAAFARNEKRNRRGDYSKAVQERERDLDYLYRRYYKGYFKFNWPRIKE
jgi:hypothetical protein